MIRMVLAPCSPFTVTKDLMVKAAQLARKYEGVRLHTHMAENQVPTQYQAHPPEKCLCCHGSMTLPGERFVRDLLCSFCLPMLQGLRHALHQ